MGSASILLAAAGMLPAAFQARALAVNGLCSQQVAVKTVRQHAGQSGQNARAPLPVLFFAR
jgi:hypothetical protein